MRKGFRWALLGLASGATIQLSCQVAEVLNADLWASQLLSEEQRATQQAAHPRAAPTVLPGAEGPIPVGTYVGQISFPTHYLLGIRSVEEDENALTVAPDGTFEGEFVHVAHESRQDELCAYDAVGEVTGTISGRLSGPSGRLQIVWEEVWRETRTGHVACEGSSEDVFRGDLHIDVVVSGGHMLGTLPTCQERCTSFEADIR